MDITVNEDTATKAISHIIQDELTEKEFEAAALYVKGYSEQSFYWFCRHVLNLTKLSRNHAEWCNEIQAKWETTENFMRLKPRGTYKTTIYGIALILWVWATKSTEARIFYTSSNGLLLLEVSDALSKYLNPASVYSRVFKIQRDSDSKNTNEIINITGRGEMKGFSLVLRTAGGSTAGVHPHMIIVDDPADKADRESAAIRRQKESWFNSLLPLLVELQTGKGRISHKIYIATRWHMDDLTGYIINRNNKNREGKRWDIDIEGVYNTDGSPRFTDIPEIGSLEAIQDLKNSMEETFFACQYLNQVLTDGIQKFPKDRLHFYSTIDYKQGKNYCFFDPSRGKKTSDYPAVIWVNMYSGKTYLFDAIDEKIVLADLLKIIAKRNVQYNVVEMVYEDNGTTLIEETLKNEHGRYPILLPLLILPALIS